VANARFLSLCPAVLGATAAASFGQQPPADGSGQEGAARGPFSICVRGIAGDVRSKRGFGDGQEASQCKILFVGASERKRWRALLGALRGWSVPTVGEWEGFLAAGGAIDLKLEGGRIRMDISTEAADRAGLPIGAKPLSLARSGKK